MSMQRSGVEFSWDPLPSLMAGDFDTLSVNVTTFRKPLKKAVTQVMAPSLRRNFEAGGRPEAWQPLVDATLQKKAKAGYPSKPLTATSNLGKRAGAFDLWTITDDAASIDGLPPAISYGIYHQTGWVPASGSAGGLLDVEPRPWAVFQTDDANDIEEIFFDWIEERIDTDIKHGKRVSF